MKKFTFVAIVLLALCSCDWQDAPKQNYAYSPIMLPSGPYHIKNEQDYQVAKSECNNIQSVESHANNYCIDQLRWEREYGSLKFLGPEKPKPLFGD